MTAFPKPVRAPRTRNPLRSTSPMKRGKPIARKTWMRRKAPRRLDTAQSNPEFLSWVHGEPCSLAGHDCRGRIEAHHAGRKPGIGMKASDDTCVPLCTRHHAALTDHRPPFAGMSREALRALQDEWVAATFGRWLSHGARRGA